MLFTKTLITILTCISLFNSFAQIEQETIDWLTEKFEQYSSIRDTNDNLKTTEFKITACTIIYENITPSSGKIYRYEIPTENITLKGYLGQQLAHLNEEKIIYITVSPKGEESYSYFDNYSAINFEFNEPNLRERLLKALKHLNTFCEGETF